MTITYAVDRLYETGWLPTNDMDLKRMPNGLRYPTVSAVTGQFKHEGLNLTLKPHLMFGCCRAEWTPLAEHPLESDLTGTVVGSCEEEAAVYALAKLREQLLDQRIAAVDSQLPLAAV